MKSTSPPVWRAHLAVLACMVAPGASLAAPLCVSLDEALTASDDQANKGALILVRAAFEEQGETVVDPPCGNEYKVAQVQTGDVFTVSLRGPERTRTGRAGSANELPKVYDQLVRAQLSGDLAVTGSQAVGRHNVTTEQANPMRARADSIFLIDLGPAIVRGVDGVPLSLGGAWRYELDQYGVQIAADFVWNPTDDTDSKTVGGSFG
ncbi:MAG: hypothetical protein KC620_19790, partial [Myxococcales bacterium]|nr:hypothetical protein [Myxococcales bacterium]